jgi:hypothetical protein
MKGPFLRMPHRRPFLVCALYRFQESKSMSASALCQSRLWTRATSPTMPMPRAEVVAAPEKEAGLAVSDTRRFACTSERPPVCSWCLSGSVLQGSQLMVAALNGVPVFDFVVLCSTFGFDVPVRLGACSKPIETPKGPPSSSSFSYFLSNGPIRNVLYGLVRALRVWKFIYFFLNKKVAARAQKK